MNRNNNEYNNGMYIVCYRNTEFIKIGTICTTLETTNHIERIYNLHSKSGNINKICFFPSYVDRIKTTELEMRFHNRNQLFNKYGLKHVYQLSDYEILYDDICRTLETMADVY